MTEPTDTQAPSTGFAELGDMLSYLQTQAVNLPQAIKEPGDLPPVAPPVDTAVLRQEIAGLKAALLDEFRSFQVYGFSAQQAPMLLREVTRCRELTFRAMQEGSGEAVDTDRFDSSYYHIVVWDTATDSVVGGYRLGRTDEILARQGQQGVYLGEMFDFAPEFFDGSPTLEIGRSFVVPDYQRHHYSLYLLWRGIGQFVVRHPQYRDVYGVVSMSRLYDPTTIAALKDALVVPDTDVQPKAPYEPNLGTPWQDFVQGQRPLEMKLVSQLVRGLEGDARDVPVLIRHYHKLGARFVSAAVDSSFNNTPGLLLKLHVPAIPHKYLKQYLGEDGVAAYLAAG